jgi:LmbE family N-acetylglucosaminyl deacetylase
MKVVFVGAHHDDEGHCSGLLLRLKQAGHSVQSLVTTAGLRDQMISEEWALVVRIREGEAAHAELGIPVLSLGKCEQEYGATKETRAEFNAIIDRIMPDMIVGHSPIDVNPDHRAAGDFVLSWAMQKGRNVETFFFEPCSAGRSMAAARPQVLAFYPTHYVDVSDPDLLETKRRSLYHHVSQDPDGMWPGQLMLQKNRGQEAGVEQAEAYIRVTRWGELHPELRELFIPSPFTMARPIGIDFTPQAIGLAA